MTLYKQSSSVNLIIILISTALIPFAFDMFFVGQLDIMRHFELDHAAPILYLWSWGMCLGQIVLAPLFDSIGRKYVFIVGVAANAILSIAAVFTGDINTIYLIRFLQGFAGAVQIIGSRAIVWDLFRHSSVSMARAYNATIIFTLIFALLSLNLSSWLITAYSWKMLFIFLAVYSVMLVLLLFLIPETLAMHKKFALRHVLVDYARLFTKRRFMIYTLIGGLIYSFLFATFTGLPVIFSQVYNLNAYEISQLFSLNLLCGISGGVLNNFLLRKNINYLSLMCFASYAITILTALILGLLLIFPHISLWIFVPIFLLIHVCISFITANSMTAAMEQISGNTGSALALYGIIQFGMGALASSLVPVVFAALGLSLFSMFLICVISMLLILLLDFYDNSVTDSSQENKQA